MTTTHAPGCYYAANPGAAAQREFERARLHERTARAALACECLTKQEAPMTTTHTPAVDALGAYGIPNEPRVYGCGCKAHIAHIEHCPTHTGCGHSMQPWKDARAILRAVEG